ncbi:MAG: alpha/beta hydrolase [Acidobacteriota bacterium]
METLQTLKEAIVRRTEKQMKMIDERVVGAILLLLLLVIPFEATGSSQACLPLQSAQPTEDAIIPGALNGLVYRRVGTESLAMDAYRQPGSERRPAVIVVHGGGWSSGSRVAYVGQFLELLTRSGYHWFSIDYRLGGERGREAAVSDLRAAVDFVRCHAAELRVDPQRIILLGEETGGTMAALVARQPAAGISALIISGGDYPVPGMEAGARWFSGLPPTLVIHGTDDHEVKPTLAAEFCRQLRQTGQICDDLPVEGASHRAENWWPSQWGYKERLIAWLDRQSGAKGGWGRSPYQVTQLRKDIVYDEAHGLKMDAWIPRGKGPFPAVILAHGGGWEAGDKVTYLTPVMRPLAEAGFAWFSIDYRLTPAVRHEEQLADLRAAIRFVYREAARYNVDRQRIAILGESASGQMVAQIATEGMPEVAAVVSFYGVYDFLPMATGRGRLGPRSIPARLFGISELGRTESETLRRYSPINQVHVKMPPLLLLCGTADGLFQQHQAMVAQLTRVGAPFETVELREAPHGMENWEGHPEWEFYRTRLTKWLDKWLKR